MTKTLSVGGGVVKCNITLAEVYGEVKGEGFSPKILRKVIALRAQDKAARDEEAALIDLYMSAVQGDLFRDVA